MSDSDATRAGESALGSKAAICGGGHETLSGCGGEIPEHGMVFRCVDCDVPFHRYCARKHFERDSGPTLERQIADLRARYALAEEACNGLTAERDELRRQLDEVLIREVAAADDQSAQRAAVVAERDELREALRAARNFLDPTLPLEGAVCSRVDALLSRHPAQPVKGTP